MKANEKTSSYGTKRKRLLVLAGWLAGLITLRNDGERSGAQRSEKETEMVADR